MTYRKLNCGHALIVTVINAIASTFFNTDVVECPLEEIFYITFAGNPKTFTYLSHLMRNAMTYIQGN